MSDREEGATRRDGDGGRLDRWSRMVFAPRLGIPLLALTLWGGFMAVTWLMEAGLL